MHCSTIVYGGSHSRRTGLMKFGFGHEAITGSGGVCMFPGIALMSYNGDNHLLQSCNLHVHRYILVMHYGSIEFERAAAST